MQRHESWSTVLDILDIQDIPKFVDASPKPGPMAIMAAFVHVRHPNPQNQAPQGYVKRVRQEPVACLQLD